MVALIGLILEFESGFAVFGDVCGGEGREKGGGRSGRARSLEDEELLSGVGSAGSRTGLRWSIIYRKRAGLKVGGLGKEAERGGESGFEDAKPEEEAGRAWGCSGRLFDGDWVREGASCT